MKERSFASPRLHLTLFVAWTLGLSVSACSDDGKGTTVDQGGGVDAVVDRGVGDAGAGDATSDGAIGDGAVGDAAGQPTLVQLGTLGGSESAAFGMNNVGQVVGWARTTGDAERHAFVWDATSKMMTDLGKLSGDEASTARAINDSGLIVGTSEKNVIAGSGEYHGFSVRADASPLVLSALPDLGGQQSWAAAINASGVIAGYAYDAVGEVAVTWKDGVLTNIGNLSSAGRTRAYGINATGQVVGWQYTAMSGQPNDAFSYDQGAWTIIGGQASATQNAEVYAVNDSGAIAGFTSFPTGAWHAARWEQGQAIDCGVLPGDDYAGFYAINASGLAVGRSYTSDDTKSRAVLCSGTTLIDLDALAGKPTGAVFWEARAINDAGDIVGTAQIDGTWQAVLLRGVTAP